MHALFRDLLDREQNIDRFFDAYFGGIVREKLAPTPVGFATWPLEARCTLRALCELFAEHVPEADHVIRQDVDKLNIAHMAIQGEFLEYFGVQLPESGSRSQFTGVTYLHRSDCVEFCVYVAGTTREKVEERQRIADTEDPKQRLDQKLLTCVDDVRQLRLDAAPVLTLQREAIRQCKGGIATPGFCPVTGQRRWGISKRHGEDTAGRLLFEFVQRRRIETPSEQVAREEAFLRENNYYRKTRAIALIRDHIAVDEAYQLALSEHA